jgi:hypothetical protein
MTTLDAMHIALIKGRSQQELTSYYTKNADLLLRYYGSPRPETDFFRISKPSQDLYHEFRARNDPSFAPPHPSAPDRCENCNAMCDEPTCGSCGCEHRTLQIERSQSQSLPNHFYHRSTHLNNVLQKLNIELPYNQREHLFARFHEISRAFQSNRDGRNNMLPYLFVLNKIFGELNLPELALKCKPRLSYAKLAEHEARWRKIS